MPCQCVMTASLLTTHWGRVPSVHRMHCPASAWLIQFRAYAAMPSFPCRSRPLVRLHRPLPSCHTMPPITLLTDMVTRCRPLAAHGLASCLSVRTQPLTATGAPSQTSTMPHHATCLRLSWTSTLLALGITPTTTAGFSKGLPALPTEFAGRLVCF